MTRISISDLKDEKNSLISTAANRAIDARKVIGGEYYRQLQLRSK